MPNLSDDNSKSFYAFVMTHFQNNPYSMMERFDSEIADVAALVSIDWYESKKNVDLHGTKIRGKLSVGLTKEDNGRTWIIGFTNEYEGKYKGKDYKVKFPTIRFQNFRKHFSEPVYFDGCKALWDEFKRYKNGEQVNRSIINPKESQVHLENLKKVKENIQSEQNTAIDKDLHWLKFMKKRKNDCPYFKSKNLTNLSMIDLYVGTTTKGPFIGEFTAIKLVDAKNDNFRGIERIYPETRAKVFRKGLNPSGAIFKVGEFKDGDDIYIQESAADAILSFILKGKCSVAALYADNIPIIAAILAERFPLSRLIFVADNDQYDDGPNKGVDVCETALRNIDNEAYLIIPEFEEAERVLLKKDLTDFYCSYGEFKTKELLEIN